MTVVTPERVVASGGAPKKRVKVWLIALVLGMIIGAGVAGLVSPDSRPRPGWQRIGSFSELHGGGPLIIDGTGVILVQDAGKVVALSAVDGRGQPVTYCKTSGYFEDQIHGSKFDGLGRYALGPSPRGLDRFAVVVLGDDVFVDKTQVIPGPARFEPKAAPPAGPFCPGMPRAGHS